MQVFKNRPLALFCGTLSAMAVIARDWGADQKRPVLLLVLLLCALAYALSRFIGRAKKLLLYATCTLLGCGMALTSSYLFFDVYLPKTQEGVGNIHTIEGVVTERGDSTSFSSAFYVRLLTIDGEDSGETVYLKCEYSSPLQLGNYVSASVYQESLAGKADPLNVRLLSDGVTRVMVSHHADDCLILTENCEELPLLFKQWNHTLSSRLYHALGREEGALATALLLGNRSYLSGDTTLAFRRVGISHLLALSGMHVAVIAGFLELLLRRLRLSKIIRAVCVPPVLLGYLLITGASPSTVRAVVMIGVLYLGFLLRADYDSVTAVCIVPAAFMLVTPYAVGDIALWMSFLAAFSIIVFHPVIRAVSLRIKGEEHPSPLLRRALATLFEAIAVGVVANAALMLLSAVAFGEISLLSVPATVVLALPMSLLLVLSIPALIVPGVTVLTFIPQKVAAAMLWGVEHLSNAEDILLCIGSGLEIGFLVVFTAVLLVLTMFKIRHLGSYAAIPVGMTLLLLISVCMTQGQPQEEMIATDSFAFDVVAEAGDLTVYDRSDGLSSNVAGLLEEATRLRCTEIDNFYLAKYDNQSPYWLAVLSSQIRVRNLYLPVPQNDWESAIAKRLEQEALLHHVTVLYDRDS